MTQPPATDPISDRRRSGFPRPRDGFIPYRRTGPYLELIGPVYETAEGPLVVGLWLDERHTNSRGFIHAGALVALADTLLGHAILREEPTISGSDTKPVATARRSGGEPSSGRARSSAVLRASRGTRVRTAAAYQTTRSSRTAQRRAGDPGRWAPNDLAPRTHTLRRQKTPTPASSGSPNTPTSSGSTGT
jgi:acyl-coenzyme A thioesterase 13